MKNNYWLCRHVPNSKPETLGGFHYLKDAKERAKQLNDKSIYIVDMYWREHKY